MDPIRIPMCGYGMGCSEYGEALLDAYDMLEEGIEYKARLVKGFKPDDWDELDYEDKEDYPRSAVDLILEPINTKNNQGVHGEAHRTHQNV